MNILSRVGKKKQNEHVNSFIKRWNAWRAHLEALVVDNGGRLICPEGRGLVKTGQPRVTGIPGSVKVTLPFPICLYSIPKTLSGPGKGQKRLAVFIDGSYELEEDSREHVRRIKTEVAFYEITQVKAPQLNLLDAYHFDFFDQANIKNAAPHPTFHAQRNIRMNAGIEQKYKDVLNQVPGIGTPGFKNHSESELSKLFQLGFLRIPTPQLDILNLGAIVAADQLVGYTDQKCWDNFQNLLYSIHGKNGDHLHVKQPKNHHAMIYKSPRKVVADWYCSR